MKRQKNRRRAAVLVGCILLACIACVRLVTAYGVLRVIENYTGIPIGKEQA